MRWRSGLCSVTFRQLEPSQIVRLAAEAGLEAIEWGTDIHAPPGGTGRAAALRHLCAEEGIACPTLGSYARATQSPRSQPFDAVLDTAEALGAKLIRVWAGEAGFAKSDESVRRNVAEAVRSYAEAASTRGLRVGLEYHPDTLTDCREGAAWLLAEAAHPALCAYWQPVPDQPEQDCRGDLAMIGGRLAHLHVFHWKGARIRHPLGEASRYWASILAGIPVPEDGTAFLEFVPGDDPALLKREAAALAAILGQAALQEAARH